ncbi:efflux RND transporter permease subunit [Polymorphobacter sp. PAMC 29334]|uniref:efflux RND transporter permease subunit n=1 Tax=Polymorphobacter sp. PAMC 29334 TaxID=2862331 RepID=UPI001C663A4E|nr:multidrug efflux RND transporter permease subunit [Polymorphobacter sp. PAMC 29334]QYE35174.1 efflux RND transporter permease subunit [Polymorphobacter sp. PAMC 29334]
MRFSHFFIDRPIFAGVISILIVLLGIFAYPSLPVAQYPEIAPPTIAITATYPGASAEVLGDTVAAPIEQQVNGVENMLYITSSSTGNGSVVINVVFKLGTNLDTAQVLVQNRVATALPRLPQAVQELGVTTLKNTPDILMAVFLTSPDGSHDIQYLSNYAGIQVRDKLLRLQGIGGINVFGARDYAMRVWINPEKAAARNLNASEIVNALRAQNVQVAGGSVGAPPFARGGSGFELSVQTQGRLSTPEEFGDIVIKADANGALTRVSDVARVEIGAQDYGTNAYVNGTPGIGLGITQLPGSNALATAAAIIKTMDEAKKDFPPGVAYSIPYNPTTYVQQSIDSVQQTLFEAVLLVVLVVLVFLQSWRAALIPVLAIPVSLIGTFAVMAAFGYSLNNLSLFGLVLAIGIVVDDAIVVVENVERELRNGLSPHDAAFATMDEVGGALVAIALTLCAVFVPTAFISGISGQFYKQFALTISAATLISCLVSLTLSPALAALLLKPHDPHASEPHGWFAPVQRAANGFNRGFDWLSDRYGRLTARTVRTIGIVLIAYVCLLGLAGWRFSATPTGFIPAQDQGYLIGVIQMPPGATLERTDAVMRATIQQALKVKGVNHIVAISGLDGASFSNAPNAATIFLALDDFDVRHDHHQTGDSILADLRKNLGGIDAANVLVIAPPPVRGIGTGGGFKMMVQNRGNKGPKALEAATFAMMMKANSIPGLTSVFTLYNTGTPRLFANIDREKAQQLGVAPSDVFSTLQTYLGSSYVNDFNLFGRTFRVTAQADAQYRHAPADIVNLKTRSASGAMVPIGSVATLSDDSGPYRVVRHNLYPAAELQGDTKPGFSSGQALKAMEDLAAKTLPEGFGYEWTELAYQQKTQGNTAAIVFALAVVFVFLLLAAQYESLVLPFAVILIVPMCLLAAIVGVNLRGFDNNILTQIGLVVLVGLAAKNAILIVEFAKQDEERGEDRWEAAEHAARTRLRPILMTSFAFILGVLPLVFAVGPGQEMRQALGTAVFFGMIGVTVFGLLFTPVFYVIASWVTSKLPTVHIRKKGTATPAALPAPGAAE